MAERLQQQIIMSNVPFQFISCGTVVLEPTFRVDALVQVRHLKLPGFFLCCI